MFVFGKVEIELLMVLIAFKGNEILNTMEHIYPLGFISFSFVQYHSNHNKLDILIKL